MMRLGMGLVLTGVLFWILSHILIVLFLDNAIWTLIVSGLIATVGLILLFFGVLYERFEEKKEEEKHDYSKY